MSGFKNLADNLRPGPDGLTLTIPDNWRQGRTAYGGLTSALSLVAAQRRFDNLPPLRSANINFIGPVSGDPVFTAKQLRQGKNVTSVQVDAVVNGGCVATSVFLFGASRTSELSVEFAAPDAPKPTECPDFTPDPFRKFVPVFFHNFETKLIDGHRPGAGANDGYIRTWSRHADPESRSGIASFLCIGDVLPPAAMPMFKRMGPVSSLNWMLNILTDNPVTEDGWWQIETRLTAARDGYASQVMRFWNTQGELVAEGMQSVAIFV